jgi:hypothetical protein
MLNIEELEKQFDSILNSFSKQDLDEWIAFAEERETLEKLSKGETVTLKFDTYQIAPIKNLSIKMIDLNCDSTYAIAA